MSISKFHVKQKFIVVETLSIDCILGADFLVEHSAVIVDCKLGADFLVEHSAVIDSKKGILSVGENP